LSLYSFKDLEAYKLSNTTLNSLKDYVTAGMEFCKNVSSPELMDDTEVINTPLDKLLVGLDPVGIQTTSGLKYAFVCTNSNEYIRKRPGSQQTKQHHNE
jgi:hypothetical protein